MGGMCRVILRRCGRGGVEFFCAGHFTTCPVVLEGLQCSRANALVYPSKMKDDLSLLSSILAIQILARLLVRIDKDVGGTTVARGNGPAVFGDELDERLPFFDVLLDVDGEWGAHHGFQEEVVIGGIVGCRVV